MRPSLVLGGLTAVLLLVLAPHPAAADPAQASVGSQRAVFARSGTHLKEKAAALSKTLKVLPYGTRVRVDTIQGDWARVTEFNGSTAGASGWLRLRQTAEPYTLSGGGARVSTRRTARGTGGVSQRDATLAGRQFDESSESAHRKAGSAALRRAYRVLDDMVEAVKPTLDEIRVFVAEGRLGRPGGRRTRPAAGG